MPGSTSLKDNIAHSKLYLLDADNPERRRVIVGSANLSERAFGGKQPETLIVFDDDAESLGALLARVRRGQGYRFRQDRRGTSSYGRRRSSLPRPPS